MAVDAAILKSVEEGKAPPTLRLYGWEPWCVTLGYNQDPSRELDPAALRERGWDFALRPTGGRAVLHAGELTYSILARRDAAPWCATLAESYDRIGAAWAKALDGFGLDMVRGAGDPYGDAGLRRESSEGELPAPPCFASSARAELAFTAPSSASEGAADGEPGSAPRNVRKVVGSAQRRTRGAFVQHGSIPVTPDHERLVEVLPLDASRREAWLRVLRKHAVSLGEITAPDNLPGEGAAWAAWERRLAAVLLAELGVQGVEGALSEEEEALVRVHENAHRERQRAFYAG
jgi:lipoate-protein ligase A